MEKPNLASTYYYQGQAHLREMERLAVQERWLTQSMGGVLAEQDNPMRIQYILDVACGTGGWLIEIAQIYPDILSLTGIDASATMLEYARSQAEAAEVSERVEFHVMDALRPLEFPTQSFDLVNHRLGMSWLRTWDWPRLLQEYRRILKPGGTVRITEVSFCTECSSAAYLQINQYYYRAFYRAGYFFENAADGLIHHLADLLRKHGYADVQTIERPSLVDQTSPMFPLVAADSKLLMQNIKPFLLKWGQLPEDYDLLKERAIEDFQKPDFFIGGITQTAWGKA